MVYGIGYPYICTATLREGAYRLDTRLIRRAGLSGAIRIVASGRDEHDVEKYRKQNHKRFKRAKSHYSSIEKTINEQEEK